VVGKAESGGGRGGESLHCERDRKT
jgi:hypothetical protein